MRNISLSLIGRDEIQVDLNDVYGEQSPSLPTIKHWFIEFKAGRTSVVDMEKSGRPYEINEKITSRLRKSSKMKEESRPESSQSFQM